MTKPHTTYTTGIAELLALGVLDEIEADTAVMFAGVEMHGHAVDPADPTLMPDGTHCTICEP